ncbi:zinc carboxypeptidase [Pontibacter ummariensis]|uniref:Zinc carboxypeptidase n=1 Tax=Pontibacter ummariensis TaxID=1610492 RepID=A0A239D2Q4_9BACT|nr:M14 metallopeptidase family protein [Pontibacter ummariensis]PRY14217.1 zinc carboxypeptidase [Pontibacter ummariensis]SNS26695.1 Zinc carboxypeptidase [Pontibacter ummariensis]
MKALTVLMFAFMTFFTVGCKPDDPMTPVTQIAQLAFAQHAAYKEPALSHRRFKHHDIVPLLKELQQDTLFDVQVVGKSVEQRDIYLVKVGTGKTKVMLWSQMHGDEPTATMALFDLFNFLQQADQLDPLRQQLLQELTLYVVPMLNPDGAALYQRRNALEIDLNRDALRLESPEARLLKSLRDSIAPDFGFNLHDQSRYYAAGFTSKPATISFLAPAFDHAQTVDSVRERAMQMIVGLNESLQQFIPGQVAKFSDEHEPRAFGDNIQKWGTSLILIESGGYKNDPEKQVIRRLNFAAMLSAFYLIATQGYTPYKRADYYEIPENQRILYDLVIRNARYQHKGQDTLVDIGIVHEEIEAPAVPQQFYRRSSVQEIGDLLGFYGYEELNAEGLLFVPGKTYERPLQGIKDLTPAFVRNLLEAGYTTVQLDSLPDTLNPWELPLNVTTLQSKVNHALKLDSGANFVLQETDGTVRYVVVNGFLYDLKGEQPILFHGVVL